MQNERRAPIVFFVSFFLLYLVLISGCADEQPTSWKDAKTIKFRSSIDGVAFDVPLNYHYRLFNKNYSNWPPFSEDVRQGKTRRAIDYINIDALLPDVEPVTEQNLEHFMRLGWGRKIRAYITHPRSFEYYFKYTAPTRLERLPDSPEVPGMLHYRDNMTEADIYLSHDHAVPELIFIRCPNYKPVPPHPSCEVATQYVYKTNATEKGKTVSKITPFYLNYRFSRDYLPQWRKIDRKLRALFNLFAQSVAQ